MLLLKLFLRTENFPSLCFETTDENFALKRTILFDLSPSIFEKKNCNAFTMDQTKGGTSP